MKDREERVKRHTRNSHVINISPVEHGCGQF